MPARFPRYHQQASSSPLLLRAVAEDEEGDAVEVERDFSQDTTTIPTTTVSFTILSCTVL